MGPRKPFLLLFLVYGAFAHAQNLVPNAGFETFTMCPVGFSQFNGYVSSWTDPNTASPDYYNACANPFPAGVPRNGTGWQQPHAGSGYAGFYTSSGTLYREFIQVQLSSVLTAGTTYLFSMYVVLHNKSKFAVDDLGAYISATAPTAAGTGLLAGNPQPQIANAAGNVLTDSLNWTLISGVYTASGGERFLTIGHLKSDLQTTMLQVNYGSQGAYYYVDDVSLSASVTLPVELIAFDAKAMESSVHASWSTATEADNSGFEVQRSVDAEAFDDLGWVEGAGNSLHRQDYVFEDRSAPVDRTLYYRLKQVDLDGHSTFSHIATARLTAGTGHFLYVLPDGRLIMRCPEAAVATIDLFDQRGAIVREQQLGLIAGAMTIDPFDGLGGLGVGIYSVRVSWADEVRSLMVPYSAR